MSLLTKSAILGKSSFDEPLMPVLFARSLASVDPDMADALAIVPWRGGTVDLEDAAIGEADAVVAYGSSHPPRRFARAYVPESLSSATARKSASR